MKSKKTLVFLAILIVTFISSISFVNAASQTWTTSLSISAGSSLAGAKRSHPNANQSIEFHWTQIGVTTTNPPTLDVTLYKKGLISYSVYNSRTLQVATNTSLSLLTYSNSGSGNYYFYFATGNAAHPTGYFQANPVYVKSYS